MAEQPVGVPTPIRLDDSELIAVGAYLRGDDRMPPEVVGKALAVVGIKLTQFFIEVAKQAVEHYDRNIEEEGK